MVKHLVKLSQTKEHSNHRILNYRIIEAGAAVKKRGTQMSSPFFISDLITSSVFEA